MKQSYSESIIDESGIELLVTYDAEVSSHTEDFHGVHNMSEVSIDVQYVELVINGESVYFNVGDGLRTANILPYLTKKQLSHIEGNLSQY